MWREIRKNPRALFYAVLVHALLIAALVFSLDWSSAIKPSGAPKAIQAHVVNDARVNAELEKLKAQEARQHQQETARQQELESAAEQARQLRVQEERRLEKLKTEQRLEAQKLKQIEQQRVTNEQAEIARKKKLAEAQKRQDTLKQQKLAEEKQQAEAQKKQAAEAEKKRRAEEQKKKAAEEKRRAEQQAEDKRRAEAERALQSSLDAEEQALADSRNQQALDRYAGIIRSAVERSWLRPPGSATGLSCTVQVTLIPGGEVVGVRVVQGSGNPAFDRSAEAAVFKASPLPLPPDPALFENFRQFRFEFSPEA
jgi:colicin import membrane protein